MTKLTATLTRHAPDLDVSATLEQDLPEGVSPESMNLCFQDAFMLLKHTVESQVPAATNRNGTNASTPANAPAHAGNSRRPTSAPASSKQINFLHDLGRELGVSLNQLNQMANGKFSVDNIHQLTRKQASELIDELQGQRAA